MCFAPHATMGSDEAIFRQTTVQALFEDARPERLRSINLGPEARRQTTEMIRLFAEEAVTRAAKLTREEGFSDVNPEHVGYQTAVVASAAAAAAVSSPNACMQL